jgi:large subunit ribosomal protein L25
MATATPEQSALDAQPRTPGTKNDARRVRREGKVPATVYGAGKQAISVSVDPRQVSRILNSRTGHNTVFDLALAGDGECTKGMIVDWQYEPIKGGLWHIDLKRIAMDQKLKVNVPIALVGTPEGVKTQGGILEQIWREVEVECLPSDIPNAVELNVSELVFGMVLRVSDLPVNPKVKFLTDNRRWPTSSP